MSELNMKEIMAQLDATNAELKELKNTYQETADYPVSTQIEYTDVLKEKAFEKAPFFRFLESKGQVLDNKAAYAGYYTMTKEADDGANFIDELEDIPSATDEEIGEVTQKMKTIVAAIEVSDMSRLGNQKFDILRRNIDRKFLDVLNLTDKTMTSGLGTTAAKDFKGIEKIITTNKETNVGDLSESIIDDMLKDIYDNNGHTDLILVSPDCAKYLKALVAPYRRFNDKIDIGLGHRVFSYESLFGYDIPIIVTPNFTNDGTAAFIDSTSFEVRRLLPPTLIQNLPTQKLATRNAIATFVTMINTGEFTNGLMQGITGAESKFYDEGE